MRTYTLIAIVFSALLLNLAAQEEQVYDLFQLGQSYRTPMDMIRGFAESRGHTFTYKAYLPPGVPIHAHWKNEKARAIASQYTYKVLCLVPYYDFKPTSPQAAAEFMKLARGKMPQLRAYLVNHWPKRSMSMAEKETWCKENLPKFAQMAARANEVNTDAKNPMCLVPRAQAFMDFLRLADRIPGFSSPTSAYNDGGHQSNNANYMFACMEYAWIFNESPLGLPNKLTYSTKNAQRKRVEAPLFDLTEQQALALQRIGYHHLCAHPMSRFSLPADNQPPPAPSDVRGNITSGQATLSWTEVEDLGVGTYKYKIQRNDGQVFENVIAHYVDDTVEEGKTYTYQVMTVDFVNQTSAPSKPLMMKTPLDREPPRITAVMTDAVAESVRVVFSEAVDPAGACDATHYAIDGLTVKGAHLAAPNTTILSTSPMKAQQTYTLTVKKLADTAAQPNTADNLKAVYTFTTPDWTSFDLTGWDKAEVEQEGAQLRMTARGKGEFRNSGNTGKPAMAGIKREVRGDFDFPLAITSQGQVAATTQLKPYQRNGNVKTGIILAQDIANLEQGNYAVMYLDDSTRFRMVVHRSWLVTARVIGAGLSHGDPRDNRNGLNLPVWIRLTRKGHLLTGYYSLTGVGEEHWKKLGAIEADRMPEKLQLGVFQISGVTEEHSTAMFDLRATGKEKSYTSTEM